MSTARLIIIALCLAPAAVNAGESLAQRFAHNRNASRALYGVKAESPHVRTAALSAGRAVMAPTISAEAAAALPESFDAEANWPQCAKVIGDIRDQSNW